MQKETAKLLAIGSLVGATARTESGVDRDPLLLVTTAQYHSLPANKYGGKKKEH